MVKGKRVRNHTVYPLYHELSNLTFGFFKTQISVGLFLSSAVLTVSQWILNNSPFPLCNACSIPKSLPSAVSFQPHPILGPDAIRSRHTSPFLLYSGTLRHVVSADAILNVSISSALTTFSYVNGHDLD